MSSNLIRLGLLAVMGTVLAGAIAVAQDRKPIESAAAVSVAVFNPVEGRIVVSGARADGSRVEIGDFVCEFDPAELRDRLARQELVVGGAQAEVNGTRIAREVAVMTLREFKDSGFGQQLATALGQAKLADSKQARAEDQLEWLGRMFAKGYVSRTERNTAELALEQARFAVEEAQAGKKNLVDHSKERTIKALTGAIASARARELAAQALLERERSAQKKLTDQIGRCKVTAPVAGRLDYAAPFGAGAVVHDGQLIFQVVTDATPRPKAK